MNLPIQKKEKKKREKAQAPQLSTPYIVVDDVVVVFTNAPYSFRILKNIVK